MHTTSTASIRQPLLRSAIACAAFMATFATTGAMAQSSSTASATAADRTRAEVIAELACARASGELDAAVLRSYGLEMVPTPRTAPGTCGPTGGTALAGEPARSATP